MKNFFLLFLHNATEKLHNLFIKDFLFIRIDFEKVDKVEYEK